MKLRKLKRKLRRQLRKETDLTARTAIERVLDDPTKLVVLNKRVEADINPWNQDGLMMGMDWSSFFKNAWDWFVTNWPAILNIIITIAPLLLLEEDE